jgi:hypothetical protein
VNPINSSDQVRTVNRWRESAFIAVLAALNILLLGNVVWGDHSGFDLRLPWAIGLMVGGVVGKLRRHVLLGALIGGVGGPLLFVGFWMSIFGRVAQHVLQ